MKNRRLEDKPACSIKTLPVPGEVTCPHCGMEIEVWSDETDIDCRLCGKLVQNNQTNLSH